MTENVDGEFCCSQLLYSFSGGKVCLQTLPLEVWLQQQRIALQVINM